MKQKLSIVGSGYVGTVVAGVLAVLGHDVLAVETDSKRLRSLASGKAPFHESAADEVLREAHASGNFAVTDDLAEAVAHSSMIFLCLGTPARPDGAADMSALEQVAQSLGKTIDRPTTLIVKSTAPLGTNELVRLAVEESLAHRGVEVSVSVVSNPEFLRTGSAVADFRYPQRIVLGSDDPRSLARVAAVYEPLIEAAIEGGVTPSVIKTNAVTAELIKYAANTFLATKVSFINEVARIAELVGGDINQVAEAMAMDPRIAPAFLQAGIGWGGSCFGKDLSALAATARSHGYDTALLNAVAQVNEQQRSHVVDILIRHLGQLEGKKVALFGVAFKPNTDDVRGAPSRPIARQLAAVGAEVVAHDPVVRHATDMTIISDPYVAASGAEAVVVVTDWADYHMLDLERLASVMRGTLIVDGRNYLNRSAIEAAGLNYQGMGT